MRVKLNVRGVNQDSRRRILEKIKGKLGYRAACRELGISRSSMHRYLRGKRKIPDRIVERCLKYLSEEELNEILSSGEELKVLGLVHDDGTLNYDLVLQVVKLALSDEYLRHVILDAIVREYPDKLRDMLGMSYANIRLIWSEDFEYFLMHRKRRRRVRGERTLRYYRNLFMRYLEGRRVSQRLVEEVVRHKNQWLRNIFRHYIQYLYYKRMISPETYAWLTLVVPSRTYRMEPRSYRIRDEDVIKTMKFLRRNHGKYYAIYRFMLESGARIMHILRIIRDWSPDEEIHIPGLGFTPRLIYFEGDGFVRYYVGFKDIMKRCEWVYFSIDTLRLLEKYFGKGTDRSRISRYAKKHGLLPPKYMRKYSWRIMVRVLGREIARFLQSRFGELKISEARYEDLLSESDELYPRYLEELNLRIYSKLG